MANLDTAWTDLAAWQDAIHEKDQQLKKQKPTAKETLPPVRTKAKLVIGKTTKPVEYFNKKKRERSNAEDLLAKAQQEKEKGNDAFKKQQYSAAVKHYTHALEYSTVTGKEHQPVYFTNRAMAYLKIHKFAEADQDCTRALELQPNNIKALWRRGMARRELGRMDEARQDFEQALVIEPGNKIFVDELNKLPKQTVKKVPQSDTKKVERRRLPITIVDEAYSANTSRTPGKPEHTAEKLAAEEASTKKAITKAKTTTTTTTTTTTLPPMKFACPKTNLEFERDWKSCTQRGADVLYEYFQMIPPSLYATLFRSSLQSDQFEQMLELLESHYTRHKSDKEIYNVLECLSQVRRIDMLVMFLGQKHQQVLQRLFARVAHAVDDRDALTKVARTYGINKL